MVRPGAGRAWACRRGARRLAPLWRREVTLAGAYAYGGDVADGERRRTFDVAFELGPRRAWAGWCRPLSAGALRGSDGPAVAPAAGAVKIASTCGARGRRWAAWPANERTVA